MTARAISVLASLVVLCAILFGIAVWAGTDVLRTADDPHAHLPSRPHAVDHSAFFATAFETPQAVTRACLDCHPGAADEVMQTSHWTWGGDEVVSPLDGRPMAFGKKNVQNNFCISISGNWPRCTSCHAGYGWKDDTFFDQADESNVDCLVCHADAGLYQKDPKGAGMPMADTDLLAAAQSVGPTTRASCGACHFKGGGGDGVKHGDLDETMYFPQARVDVHMGVHGLVCTDCHQAEDHHIRGRLLPTRAAPETRVACTDCHATRPHAEDRLNEHVKTLACQTCHIPTFAVETGTKMWWDWSYAGREGDEHEIAEALTQELQTSPDAREGVPTPVLALIDRVGTDPDVWTHYARKKGLFVIARRQIPEYAWYDGTTERYVPGEGVTPGELAYINRPHGSATDADARIWPFKVHRGRQPADADLHHLLTPHVFGKGGYWKTYDWPSALASGADASGVPFSGAFGWQETAMYWPQNHMVQRKEAALQCADCHGDGGRMDWTALGYSGDPAYQGDRRQAGLVRPQGDK